MELGDWRLNNFAPVVGGAWGWARNKVGLVRVWELFFDGSGRERRTIIKGNSRWPELAQGGTTENRKKGGEKKTRAGGGLEQITRLMIQRKRQQRANSDLPFTDLSDLVPSDLSCPSFAYVGCELGVVYAYILVIYGERVDVHPKSKHKNYTYATS